MKVESIGFSHPSERSKQSVQAAMAVQHATVLSSTGGSIEIDTEDGIQLAQVCFSCLVQPLPGDIVLVTQVHNSDYYITGIIDRPEGQGMTLAFPGETTLRADAGPLNMVSAQSITLASEKLNCVAHQTIHKSHRAVVDFDELTARGADLQANYNSIRVFSSLLSTMAKQVISKFKNYVRHTEEYDHVKSGKMGIEVEGLYTMDSKYTVMVSKKDTKIDGERIHMG